MRWLITRLMSVLFCCRTPEQCPSVVSLLAESYNPHVRYGAAMALGIACAGTGLKVILWSLLVFSYILAIYCTLCIQALCCSSSVIYWTILLVCMIGSLKNWIKRGYNCHTNNIKILQVQLKQLMVNSICFGDFL